MNCLKLIVKLIEEAQSLIGISDSNETVNYPPTIIPLSFSILHLDDQLILDHIFYTQLKKCWGFYLNCVSLSKSHQILRIKSLFSLFSLLCRSTPQHRIQFYGLFWWTLSVQCFISVSFFQPMSSLKLYRFVLVLAWFF